MGEVAELQEFKVEAPSAQQQVGVTTHNLIRLVEKVSKILDNEPFDDHVAALAMLQVAGQRRGVEMQRAAQDAQSEARARAQFAVR